MMMPINNNAIYEASAQYHQLQAVLSQMKYSNPRY